MTRSEVSDMIALAERLIAAAEIGVVATLFSSTGSTYRRLGSMMVAGPGAIVGGVSGGCLEEFTARHGRELVQRQPAALLNFDVDSEDDTKPSLGCGGSIEVLVERLTGDHVTFLRQRDDASRRDEASMSACILGTQSMTVHRIWHNEDPQNVQLRALQRRVAIEKQSRHGRLDPSRRALVDYIPPMTRMVILGAGDDVRPVCDLARSLGWHVTVADRRARLVTKARFPEVDQLIAADWHSALGQITFTRRTAVLLMTHSIDDDIEIVSLLAGKPATYIGMLGPAERRRRVLQSCHAAPALAARVIGPVGLDLGDRSTPGIAVAIVGEILAVLNSRDAAPLSTPADSFAHA